MTIEEAAQMLKIAGFETRKMVNNCLIGGKIEFSIYQENAFWIVSFSGPGQKATIIKRDLELESVITAIVHFYQLKSDCHCTTEILRDTIWRLQENGLLAEIGSKIEIDISRIAETILDDPYSFILNLDESNIENIWPTLTIRWSETDKAWTVLLADSNKTTHEYHCATLPEAADIAINYHKSR